MAKELRKFLLNFPYLPRPRIIKEGVEEASRRTTLLFFSLFSSLGVAGPFFPLLSFVWPKPSRGGDSFSGRI